MKGERNKILYVITKSNFGGAQRYVYDLACYAKKGGFDVSVLLGGRGLLAEKLQERNIRVISLSRLTRDVRTGEDLYSFFVLWKIIRKEQPDIIHLNSSKIGLLGALATRICNLQMMNYKLRTKIIFTAHGWVFTEKRNYAVQKVLLLLQWFTVILSDETIAVSRKTKEEIAHLPFAAKKIRVVYNAIHEPHFLPRGIAQKYIAPHFLHKRIWVGMIAELHKNKGIDCAIHAAENFISQCPDACIIIIGSGDEHVALERLITNKTLGAHVFLAGYKKNAASYLKAFDIFLLPSRKEGFPYALLEAGHAGVPVVASEVGGIPEIIEHKKTGLLIPPSEANAIVNALNELTQNETLRRRYGLSLNQKVRSRFSHSRMCRETTSCY